MSFLLFEVERTSCILSPLTFFRVITKIAHINISLNKLNMHNLHNDTKKNDDVKQCKTALTRKIK